MAGLDRTRDTLFVERLHAKTLARGLTWAAADHEGRFQTRIGEFLIEIGEAGGQHEVLICRPDGRALEIITPAQLGSPTAADAFAETWEGARRAATGVDSAIDSLIAQLA